MSYDKDAAQAQLRVAHTAVYRGYPVVAVSLFESTGEALITYGNADDGFFTGPLAGGPVGDLEVLKKARVEMSWTDNVPIPGMRFKHFKGGFYLILARSIHEYTGTVLVTYRSELNGTNWTRTLDDFNSRLPRFTLQS